MQFFKTYIKNIITYMLFYIIHTYSHLGYFMKLLESKMIY
jgi:hypothetical protein